MKAFKISYALFIFCLACAQRPVTHETQFVCKAGPGYAPIHGLKMYYEVHGQGFPLVLVHGGGSTIESNFSRILPLLASRHTVIAVEEQGHGHTAAIDRPFTFENSADDIAALLDYLKIPRADVMGFSNGGSIAMRVAIRHPEKVNKIIVASAQYRREGMVKGFWQGMNHAKLEDMPKSLQEADRKINPDPRHLEQLFKQDSGRMQNFKDWPDKDLQSIKAPALILIGDRDIITREHAIKMANLIPRGRLAVLPGNHGSYLGEASGGGRPGRLPEAAAIIVDEFLGENE